MPDKYEIRTQYYPALLCSAPFIAFGFYFLSQIETGFWSTILAQAVSGISMTVALYYLAAYVCRHMGKWLEDKTFKKGLCYPTTEYLVEGSALCSRERQNQIIGKIRKEFKINLVTKQMDTTENRQRINEAVSGIRSKFFRKNEIILQRNIQFGFAKNLAGGALISVFVSLGLIALSILTDNRTSLTVSSLLTCWYLILSVFGLIAMRSNSTRYAHTLFDEYLAVR